MGGTLRRSQEEPYGHTGRHTASQGTCSGQSMCQALFVTWACSGQYLCWQQLQPAPYASYSEFSTSTKVHSSLVVTDGAQFTAQEHRHVKDSVHKSASAPCGNPYILYCMACVKGGSHLAVSGNVRQLRGGPDDVLALPGGADVSAEL